MVSAAGGTPIRLPIARDLREDIHQRILAARSANLLILSGGVSMGEYDLVEEVLTTFGAEFLFTGVRMQPGKPVVFGRLPARGDAPELYFFGLPGNPISTQVTFHCFAELFLRTLAGEPNPARKWALATLTEPVQAKPNLTRLLPARLEGTSVTTTPWQGSGDLAANARANCYVEFKPNTAYAAGDTLRILLR
jgi:molybdopterin molybdotransferase